MAALCDGCASIVFRARAMFANTNRARKRDDSAVLYAGSLVAFDRTIALFTRSNNSDPHSLYRCRCAAGDARFRAGIRTRSRSYGHGVESERQTLGMD